MEDHGLFRLVDTQVRDHASATKSARTSIHFGISGMAIQTWHSSLDWLEIIYRWIFWHPITDTNFLQRLPSKEATQSSIWWRASLDSKYGPSVGSCRDVVGPMNKSIIGTRYFLIFVEDYNKKMWVYFLTMKPNVFNEFQRFKVLVENESYCYVPTLRTDSDRELCSN